MRVFHSGIAAIAMALSVSITGVLPGLLTGTAAAQENQGTAYSNGDNTGGGTGGGTDSNAPVAQPLTREGDLAVKLLDILNLGNTKNEAEAEDALTAAGISPKNGWIADYPVTPDVTGELQDSIEAAADSGKISMNRDQALAAFQKTLDEFNLPVSTAGAGTEAPSSTETPSSEETTPGASAINNYYYTQGPPVVTYYSPPPDYAYLYTWVPYPFWWWNVWFPGYYMLVDFDFDEYGEFHHHRHHFSNHFRDPDTGRITRIDPTTRAIGGTFTGRPRYMGPAARRGAQSILRRSTGTSPSIRTGPEMRGPYRGYGVTRPPAGTRSSVFQRWGSTRFEGAASTRGFQSRSRAGQIPSRNFSPGGTYAPGRTFTPSTPGRTFSAPGGEGGITRGGGGGFQGFHGSGGFIGGGGGISRGGGGFRR